MKSLVDDLALKAISLVLAVLLWFVVAGEKTSEMGFTVPVELQNFPKDMELTGPAVNTVDVRLRASPGIIQRLGPREVSVFLDLKGITEGEHIFHLTENTIRHPFGVKVVKINPSTLTLNLEHTLEKGVPIQARIVKRPSAGFELAEVVTEPAGVRIAGPRSRVEAVDRVSTEPVSLEGAEATVVTSVNIGLGDPLLRIEGSPTVKVTARIRELQTHRSFDGIPLEVRGGTASTHPSRVSVILSGPASALDRISSRALRAYVDASRLDGAARLPVVIELAPGSAGVAVHTTDPREVWVRPAPSAPGGKE